MQIGDKVRLHPSQSPADVFHTGTVVYIHPQRRYYEAEFSFTRRDGVTESYRESFYFRDREGDMTRGTAMPEDEKEKSRGKYRG